MLVALDSSCTMKKREKGFWRTRTMTLHFTSWQQTSCRSQHNGCSRGETVNRPVRTAEQILLILLSTLHGDILLDLPMQMYHAGPFWPSSQSLLVYWAREETHSVCLRHSYVLSADRLDQWSVAEATPQNVQSVVEGMGCIVHEFGQQPLLHHLLQGDQLNANHRPTNES